jgi:hypothetical protein
MELYSHYPMCHHGMFLNYRHNFTSFLHYKTLQVPTIFRATDTKDISLRNTGPFVGSRFNLGRYMKDIFCAVSQQLKLFVCLTNEETGNVYKTLACIPLDMNLLGHQEGEGRIILRLIFKKWIVRMEMNWTGSGSMSSCRIWY